MNGTGIMASCRRFGWSPAQPTSLLLAAGQARAEADAGRTALVIRTGDESGPSAYVWRGPSGYVVDAATLWEPDWIGRLRRVLTNAEETT